MPTAPYGETYLNSCVTSSGYATANTRAMSSLCKNRENSGTCRKIKWMRIKVVYDNEISNVCRIDDYIRAWKKWQADKICLKVISKQIIAGVAFGSDFQH